MLVPNNTRFHAIIISLVIFIFEALHFLRFSRIDLKPQKCSASKIGLHPVLKSVWSFEPLFSKIKSAKI